MKYLGILIMAILLMGAGGAGGYLFFQKEAIASLGEANKEIIKNKMERDKAARLSEEAVKDLRFVQLEPIILPVIDAKGVNQVITLIVSLEVDDAAKEEYVELLKPRLKDAYIQDMYGVLNSKASMKGGVIKAEYLKKRLNRVSAKVLGKNKVNGVLLQVVNQRPI